MASRKLTNYIKDINNRLYFRDCDFVVKFKLVQIPLILLPDLVSC